MGGGRRTLCCQKRAPGTERAGSSPRCPRRGRAPPEHACGGEGGEGDRDPRPASLPAAPLPRDSSAGCSRRGPASPLPTRRPSPGAPDASTTPAAFRDVTTGCPLPPQQSPRSSASDPSPKTSRSRYHGVGFSGASPRPGAERQQSKRRGTGRREPRSLRAACSRAGSERRPRRAGGGVLGFWGDARGWQEAWRSSHVSSRGTPRLRQHRTLLALPPRRLRPAPLGPARGGPGWGAQPPPRSRKRPQKYPPRRCGEAGAADGSLARWVWGS